MSELATSERPKVRELATKPRGQTSILACLGAFTPSRGVELATSEKPKVRELAKKLRSLR